MVDRINLAQLRQEADYIFHNGFACSESVIYAVRKALELDIPDDGIAMSTGFPWGLGGVGCLCGAVAGGAMCLGYLYGRRQPGDPCVTRCHALTKEFGESILAKFGSCCCGKLIEGYADRDCPERKCFCTELVDFAVCEVARIVAREEGIPIEE